MLLGKEESRSSSHFQLSTRRECQVMRHTLTHFLSLDQTLSAPKSSQMDEFYCSGILCGRDFHEKSSQSSSQANCWHFIWQKSASNQVK